MLHYTKFTKYEPVILGKKNKFDNNIYSFDIETSSFVTLNGIVIPASEYDDKSHDKYEYYSNMYIWQLSINDTVYYGRTWEDFIKFITMLDNYIPERKIIFIHNLSYEFQYLRSVIKFDNVQARKSRKVMRCYAQDYNIEFRCSYMMSNVALSQLPKIYNLPITKMVGDLDYTKLRTSITPLSNIELGYCEHDCLVVYYYIKRELETYDNVDRIPITSTGHVRRELHHLIDKDWSYKHYVARAINTDPHIYNLLIEAFAGGYTHANWIYANEVLKDIDSWDFTSSYPYILVTCKFPASEFRICHITDINNLLSGFAYIIKIKLTNLKSKLYNNFISISKCRVIKGGHYDNGRIISADELETTITDIDLKYIKDSYDFNYEIIEIYYSIYKYLPKQFINFVLEKYINKTKYKGIEDKQLEYQLEKAKFNSLYGMSVTNMIKDNVIFDDKGWKEEPLTNDEIIEKLDNEKKKAFLSFAYGVWVTAYARYNLISNIIKLDDKVVYCDTDSIKLVQGYNKSVIDDYNKSVIDKINYVSKILKIPINKYAPKDIYDKEHMLGLFDFDGHYDEFITQGAKKYAVMDDNKINITVAGVPKAGAKALTSLSQFKDNFVFDHKYTNKNTIIYIDYESDIEVKDYLGTNYLVTDKTGCCMLPASYTLGKSIEYASLISDESSARAIYKEVK